MPVSFVNRTSEARSTSATTISPSAITVATGDYLIAYVSTRATGNQLPTHTISSTGGSVTWTSLGFFASPAVTALGTGITTTIFSGSVVTGGSVTITATFSAASNGRVILASAFRGVVAPPTTINTTGTSSTSPVGPGAWTTQSGDVGDAILLNVSADLQGSTGNVYSTSTVGGTWSTGFNVGIGTNPINIATQHKILTAGGTQSAFYTNSAAATKYWTSGTVLLLGSRKFAGWGIPL